MSHFNKWNSSTHWWTYALTGLCGWMLAWAQGPSMLWKIEGKGLPTSYLFGTLHVSCQGQALPNKVRQALNQCTTLVLEMDLDQALQGGNIMKAMQMKDGQSLKKIASPEDYTELEAYVLQHLGLPLSMMDSMSPMMLQTLLMTRQMDCLPESTEEKLLAVTRPLKKPVQGLETADEQLAVLTSIPYSEQWAELMAFIRLTPDAQRQQMQGILQQYQSDDLDQLYAWLQQQPAMSPDFDQKLLVNRNLQWLPKLQKMLRAQSHFIGVGAAHLAGPKGLIVLLREKGFILTPVR